jgi:FHA domain-containing protein
MRPLALEPDDRAFALARAGVVLASSPAAVADGSAGRRAGDDAWDSLRLTPVSVSTRHTGWILNGGAAEERVRGLAAAELARRLRAHPPLAGEPLWIAAPARAGAAGLGALLAITRSVSLPVEGFVDAAVASCAALDVDGAAIVLEFGLHHAGATLVERAGGGPTCRRRAILSERGGVLELYQAWLELINTALVRQTRFEALREAAAEQRLFAALPELARAAQREGRAMAVLELAGRRLEVALTRDQLAQAAQPLWREVARLVHELRPAGAALALVLPGALAALPGLVAALAPFEGCERIELPDGFAAAATSLLELPARAGGEPVRLLRRLPAGARPGLAAQATRIAPAFDPAPTPSHLLFSGRTYQLGAEPLVIGRAPQAAHGLALSEGLAGVSRRHCTLLREGSELVLLDHSRFGTFVNGERVAERVRLRAGDQLRIGDPGVELALIAVLDGSAS